MFPSAACCSDSIVNLRQFALDAEVWIAASTPNIYPSQPSPSASTIVQPSQVPDDNVPPRSWFESLSSHTHPSMLKFCVKLSDSSFTTTTVSSVPSNSRAPPNLPVVHVAPDIVPVLLLSDSSKTDVPEFSFIFHLAE